MRLKTCRTCKTKFAPARPMQTACSPICALERAKVQREAAEKKQDRARLKEMRPISKLEEECRRIVQKIARIRDRNEPCISCNKPASWDGQWHGSHFRSHAAASAVQFHLWNINKACWICNKLYSGRINEYEPSLVQKIGAERVDWLKAQNQVVRRDRAYLERFKKIMGKRLRRMEKKYAA